MSFFDIFRKKDINAGVDTCRKTPGAILLDVRTREEYESGHIEGSINLPLADIDKIDGIAKDRDSIIFVHCLSGARSMRAASMLKSMGYLNITDIGGINSYKGKIIS